MKDEKGGPRSNLIALIRKQSGPTPLSSAMMLQGLELIKIFMTIPSAERRKQIVELARRIAAGDTAINHDD
jgi:hypothetical protein